MREFRICICVRGVCVCAVESKCFECATRPRVYPSILSCELVAERAGVVRAFGPSEAPKLVWRRSSDPNPRRLFDSSEFLDDIEPVL